jgi:AcrR family transcriptional regulator
VDVAGQELRELPLAEGRPERGDASANRRRILQAARRLLAEHGPAAVSMDAVAAAAGVGKGTVFRRFGDRAGLTEALVNDYMRDFQDAFLTGPPPLGPGAAPAERLEAFMLELVRLQREHLPLALAAEMAPWRPQAGVYGSLFLHTRALVRAVRPELDPDLIAAMLLGAIAPPVLHRVQREHDVGLEAVNASIRALLQGLARDLDA